MISFSSDPKASTRDVHFAHDLASLKSLTPETEQQSKKKNDCLFNWFCSPRLMKCSVDQICTSFHCGLSRRDRYSGCLGRWVHRLHQCPNQCRNQWSAPVPLFLSRAHHVRKHQANMLLQSTLELSRTRTQEQWFLHVTMRHQKAPLPMYATSRIFVFSRILILQSVTRPICGYQCSVIEKITSTRKECLRVVEKNVDDRN